MRIGLDIGGTKTEVVAVDDSGAIVLEARYPSGFGADAVLAAATMAVFDTLDRLGETRSTVTGVGVGIPGLVNHTSGRVEHAVNLGIQALDLAGALRDRVSLDVSVDNDVNVAAVGMFRVIAGQLGRRAPGSLAYLNLGTWLAAGLVFEGRPWRGFRGTAGEIGHLPARLSSATCPCGQTGCLEATASGSGLDRVWPSADGKPAVALLTAAGAGDPRAVEVEAEWFDQLLAAIKVLVLTLDVEVIAVGGGMSRIGQLLLDGIGRAIERSANESAFIAHLDIAERIELAPDDLPVAALGAALIVPEIEGVRAWQK